MTIVFDLDNTLVDEFGAAPRPWIAELLGRLQQEGHALVLWTNSRRERALEILRRLELRGYFRRCICREDYDPEEKDVPKDIRKVHGDLLIDDDPQAVAYVRSTGRRAILIRAFRKGRAADRRELAEIYRCCCRTKR
jgi:phosphoglycolate phosphatase-like HAD superfamily hydrolase